MKWFNCVNLATALLGVAVAEGQEWQSSLSYPSPWSRGGLGWQVSYEKAKAFVSQLTLLEKVNLTTGVGWAGERCSGNTGSIPRLNFSGLCMADAPLGVRGTDGVTAFPAGINTAATWSTRLMKTRGNVMGVEFNGKGIDVQLGPASGPIGRHPDGGRNWEGFSPDPVLAGVSMRETIKGIQDAGVVACAKHYILNEQENWRDYSSSNADDVTMHELYLWPFADAVKAGVGSVMCSYNQINNSYGCENSYTLNRLLKNELDFQGFVMSDWNAQHTGVGSALAGLDMSMPGDTGYYSNISHWGANLTASVVNGTIPLWRIDDMAIRIMAAFYKVGRDKKRVPINYSSWDSKTVGPLHNAAGPGYGVGIINEHVNVGGDHIRIAREVAQRSTVLLKNAKGALPLSKPRSVAVIGEDAHANPAGPNSCYDKSCDIGTLGVGWGSGSADFLYQIVPVDALRTQAINDKSQFRNFSNNYDLTAIRKVATGAAVALVFANADSGEAYITVDDNHGDRKNLTFWQGADAVIDEVAEVNSNTILVIHSTGAVLIEKYKNHPNVTGIIWAGLPGPESGNAITDVLYGRINPSAKTVYTWGKQREDWGAPIVVNVTEWPPQVPYTEGVFIDYRHFDQHNIEPSYEFGFGLTYTEFKYSNLKIKKLNPGPYEATTGKTNAAPFFGTIPKLGELAFPANISPVPGYIYPWVNQYTVTSGDGVVPSGSQDGKPQPKLRAGGSAGGNRQLYDEMYEVTADITNTGKVDGIEVVQLYVALGGANNPKVVLRGFDDLSIRVGGTTRFTYKLTRRDLSNWDPTIQDWVISSEPKTVYVGASSRKLHLKGKL